MVQRCVLAMIAVTAGACAGGHKRVCRSSIEARADGAYANLTLEQARRIDREKGYACASACYDLYSDDSADAQKIRTSPLCVESELLTAEADLTRNEDVQQLCTDGVALACAWLESHEARIEEAKAARVTREAAEEQRLQAMIAARGPVAPEAARPTMTAAAAKAAIDRAAAATIADARANGLVLVSDREYDVSDGATGVDLDLFSETYYQMSVIGGHTTTFRATFGGTNFTEVEFPVREIAGDVFVRATGLKEFPLMPGSDPRLFIREVSGDRHDVRVLIFKRY